MILFDQPWENLLDFCRSGNGHLWAVGLGGAMWSTDSAGKSWARMKSGISYEWLNGISCVGPGDIWVAGSEGTLIHTVDGGQNWDSQSFPGTFFNDILFLNSSIGLACGQKGLIIRTDNGGKSWQKTTPLSEHTLTRLAGFGLDHVWAVGGQGSILRSTDAGKTWQACSAGTDQMLYGICFIDQSLGWVCGRKGIVLHTTDGGGAWVPQKLPTEQELCTISFVDATHGITAGGSVAGNAAIWVTVDGGASWKAMNDPFQKWWKAAQLVSIDECILAGNDRIVRFSISELQPSKKVTDVSPRPQP
jgi:photosystem II stability/assembly factor-like uncharacterized protein